MAIEQERVLYERLHEGQSKLRYYLLTAAAAGIGLAVNQTRNSAMSWSQVSLGLAVFCWAASFLFGCLKLQVYCTCKLQLPQGSGGRLSRGERLSTGFLC
jgi:hypothetical protein